MRTARLGVAVLAASLVTAGCTAGSAVPSGRSGTQAPTAATQQPATATPPRAVTTPVPSTGPDAWLAVTRKGVAGVKVLLAGTGEGMFDLPVGTPADARWSRLVTTTRDGAGTLVRTLIVQPGLPSGRDITVPGAWRLPTFASDPITVGLSTDGSTIVLVEEAPNPTETTFAVLHAPFEAPARFVSVRGAFTFDAVSPDGRTIFVIEHLPAPPEGHYQVRAIDVAGGALKPDVIVDKLKIGEQMAGWPLDQLRRDDGSVLTLYRGAGHPFIHALYSADGYADCIDLPASPGDTSDAALDWGIAPARSGGHVFAVNATLGLAAEISPADRSVIRTSRIAPALSAGVTLAKFGHDDTGPVGRRTVLSTDGRTLYSAGKGGVVVIGTARLAETGRFLAGQSVDALALTPDGTSLYALLGGSGRIANINTADGRVLGYVPGDGYTGLLAIVPW
jgi:DNA-binding beta-propeller fold protein YncE